MNKFNISVIVIICFVFILLSLIGKLYQNTDSPQIFLPGSAHHTIGEMPILEHFDDGDLEGRSGYSDMSNSKTGFTGGLVTTSVAFMDKEDMRKYYDLEKNEEIQ